jgi:hypothetical protein
MEKKLWKILVPVTCNGKKIKKKRHRKWDAKVSDIAGGLTLFKPKKGRWKHGGQMFREKMIRVEIAATATEIVAIARMTAEHYEQKAVMYYKKSDFVSICEY